MYLGIDISSVRDPIDWQKVKSKGTSFIVFRGTYSTWADPSYAREAQKARDAGLTVGAYLFPLMDIHSPMPDVQVKAFVKAIGDLSSKDFPPILDVEFSTPITRPRAELLNWIRCAVQELKLAYDRWPMIYTSARVWDGHDVDCLGAEPTPDLVECPLWLACYPYKTRTAAHLDADHLPLPPAPKSWGVDNVWIHQYQDDALDFPGIARSVDLNRFFDLRLGSKGERVKWLQQKLGVSSVDGIFGQKTQDALFSFQRARGLTVDGIVGPKTFAALS